MFSSTLSTIKKHYQKDIGNCNREHGFAEFKPGTPIVLARYHINVINLFRGYQAFLKAKDAKEELDEKEYDTFFGDIVSQGAPAETIVCAAMQYEAQTHQSEPDSGGLQFVSHALATLCPEWDINFHSVLQFVVLEFLNNENRLGSNIYWDLFIKLLIELKADPNYRSNTYHQVLTKDKWICPLQEMESVFEFTLYQSDFSDKVIELANLFLEQQKKVQTQLRLHPGVTHIMDKSLEESKRFLSTPRWQWLERNCPEEVKEYLSKHSEKFISNLAKKGDFDAIEYFRNPPYEVDVLPILLTISAQWPNPTLDYAYRTDPQRTKDFIRKNNSTCLKRFNMEDLIKSEEFKTIDGMINKYEIDPFVLLWSHHLKIAPKDNWTHTAVFPYLEKRFYRQLEVSLERHKESLLSEFLYFKDSKSLSQLNLKAINNEQLWEIMRIISNESNKMNGYSRTNILTMKLFQKLEKDNLERIRSLKVFLDHHCDYAKSMSYLHLDVRIHLTLVYNVDWFSLNESPIEISNENMKKIHQHYKALAKHILDFIFQQEYPDAIDNVNAFMNRSKTAVFESKKVIVSPNLYNLIELLKKAFYANTDNASLFNEAHIKACKLASLSTGYGPENLIYASLFNYFNNLQPLSQYINSNFKLQEPSHFTQSANTESKDLAVRIKAISTVAITAAIENAAGNSAASDALGARVTTVSTDATTANVIVNTDTTLNDAAANSAGPGPDLGQPSRMCNVRG